MAALTQPEIHADITTTASRRSRRQLAIRFAGFR
jgi:hypothetical protein